MGVPAFIEGRQGYIRQAVDGDPFTNPQVENLAVGPGTIQGFDPGVYDVADEDEIPHLLAVRMNDDRLSLEDIGHEIGDHALVEIRQALTRSVHIEQAEVVARRRGVRVAFGGVLGDPVVGNRPAGMIFADRYVFGASVTNHGTGIKQPRHLVLQAGLQDIESPTDIDAQIVVRIGKRKNRGGLAGDLEDRVQSPLKGPCYILWIAHIAGDEVRCCRHIATHSSGFVVQDDDFIAVRQQPFRHVAADETRAPRNQNPSAQAEFSSV